MESKVGTRGGKRPGAGRKPGPDIWVRMPVPREVWAIIEADAGLRGHTPQQHVAEILAQHVASPLCK